MAAVDDMFHQFESSIVADSRHMTSATRQSVYMPAADDRLPHGYTNLTRRAAGGAVVEKMFVGSDALDRLRREELCLAAIADVLPVPRVVDKDEEQLVLRLGWIEGAPGQDLIEQGHERPVLRATGELLAEFQTHASTLLVPHLVGAGTVAVHGDFGPQNLLLVHRDCRVAGLVDWEFAHLGGPEEDLAWAEWIVRMHHASSVEALDELFVGYGTRPPWSVRHGAMVHQCESLLSRCETEGLGDAVEMWQSRLLITEGWVE